MAGPNLAGMLNQGGIENPEYPWRRMEADLARTQMLRQLQASQDEALKKQQLERGMEEQQAKQNELFHSMLVRQLQGGWGPPPGVDIGGFSKDGAPMQQQAIGPGTQGPQNIQKYDEGWSKQPELDEATKLKFRQYLFPGAKTPRELETPGEIAKREEQRDINTTTRAMLTQEEISKRAEKRGQGVQERRDKEIELKAQLEEEKEGRKAYQADLAQAQKAAFEEEMKLKQATTDAELSTLWSGPEKEQKLRKIYQLGLRDIRGRHEDRKYEINQKHGYDDQSSGVIYKARQRFAGFDPELLQREKVESFDHFKAAAEQAGVPLETALANWEMYQKEAKGGKSK
jgi:hypothetical protein